MALEDVDLDVLLLIFSHLDASSLASLSRTCRALHRVVEQHGWSTLIRGGTRRLSVVAAPDSKSSNKSFSPAKHTVCVDCNWQKRRLIASQNGLPPPPASQSPRKGGAGLTLAPQHPSARPMPLLLLTPSSLLLFTRSELRCWPASALSTSGPIDLQGGRLSLLINPNGLDGAGGGSTAYWDISACAQLDRKGEWIAIGRANGLMEVIHIDAELTTATRAATRKSRSAKNTPLNFVNLAWLSDHAHSTGSPIQSVHSDQRGLVAFGAKNGVIELYKVSFEDGAANRTRRAVRLLLVDRWSIGKRPWSMWLGGAAGSSPATWLAVGTMGSEPLVVFPLDSKTHRPGRPIGLTCAPGRKVAVHALASSSPCAAPTGSGMTPIDPKLLFAGCYDGILRVYDVPRILSSGADEGRSPVYEFQDRFGPSAIFSLALGVGKGGRSVAAGVATHGVVKFFDVPLCSAWARRHRHLNATAKRQIVIGEGALGEIALNGTENSGDCEEPPSRPPRCGTKVEEQGDEEDCEAGGWSLYASGPRGGNSPVYSLVAQHDRLFGVTDSRLCELDLRPSLFSTSSSSPRPANGTTNGIDHEAKRRQEGRLAYYRHLDMNLEETELPP
ncbi:hypothetical protein FA10DRAFT_266827 [Acaromyces ingoldii]|uniref:F-box domain-containing protein n=1 Tax=Acaromyces ingoldii TaxID=215250 RepID=A0A316YLT3_9BASI|nr:hypothetical protein FA10DRAFT_266827 [Acaromyces ingoldii]PWN90337.1 hypothetical protein FA10DRAFT_266827 [Acaromyces ingoldii]